MQAVQIREYGGSAQLVLAEVPVPVPKPGKGEALVEISHAGVNFIDVYMRQGVYRNSETYRNEPPFIPGMEGGGIVADVGPGVHRLNVGDRVAYCLVLGSYARYAAVPAWRLAKVPDDVLMPVAVTLMLQGSTAHYLSHSLFDLRAGMTCLVHAGAGGVGQLLTQIARMKGARVISTVGSAEKAAGVHVVYDGVGQATFTGSLKALRRRGTLALFGGASGAVKSVNPLDLAEAGSVFLTRPHLWDYTATAEEIDRRAGDLFKWVAEGRLKVAIDREFPLGMAKAAHDVLESRQSKGKIILNVEETA
ncbi:MAG: quinone oxidoreductase [Rhodospirillales bacterium]|nr:quinone oxidoreductase [Rhodospirillales bacterium]